MYYGWGWWWVVWVAIFFIFIVGLSSWGFSGSRRGRSLGEGDRDVGPRFGPFYYPVGPYSGIGPRSYQRTDERIVDEINDRLTVHGDINASEVEVTADQGEVILRGTVENRRCKRLAEEIADSVAGVRDVRNELVIGTLSGLAKPLPGKKAA